MSDMVVASYRLCRRVARRSSSSFYYSFLLLPKPKRLSMCALYAFLRRTDDLVDGAATMDDRRRTLEAWRCSLDRALAGSFDDPLLPALAHTVARYEIPPRYLHQVIDGVAMDLEPRSYESFDDLEQYCYRVACVVGFACLRIWGCNFEQAVAPARQCGLAFQLTNILRDLKEDAARGRVYLPREDLQRFGYSVDDLRAGVRDERFRRLMRFEIERAEAFYDAGAQIEQWLDVDGRRTFGSMVTVYRALLDEIKRRDGDVLTTRVRLSNWRKMRIATRWFLRTPAETVAGANAS